MRSPNHFGVGFFKINCCFSSGRAAVTEKPETKKDDDGKEVIEQPKAEVINETNPLWKKDPKEITEDQYKEFYRKLYPMDGDPLFWIHLKIDHPFLVYYVNFQYLLVSSL